MKTTHLDLPALTFLVIGAAYLSGCHTKPGDALGKENGFGIRPRAEYY